MENANYEQAVAELESILEKLEKGGKGLGESIDLFSQGINLVKICDNYLNDAETKIKVLLEDEIKEWDLDGED